MTSTRNSCLAAGALTLTWLLGPGGAPAQAVPSTWQKPIQVATTGAAAKPAPASPVVSLTLTPNQIVLDGPRSL
ncbi:MAG: hypothetical protein FJX77_17400, partial [Armatimonadetes bacterium]|nr:hypothetical protein [Armatimonadota bacterium]